MISIFNGNRRALGETQRKDYYIQMSVEFRQHLHLLKGPKLAIFLCISLHSDENGLSFPKISTIERETGYGRDAIFDNLKGLEEIRLNGARLLYRYQPRAQEKGVWESNHYLIFPTDEEIAAIGSESSRPTTVSAPDRLGSRPTHEEEPVFKVKPKGKEERTHVRPKERKSITSADADAPICPKCRNAGKYIGNGQTLALCLNCNERFLPFGESPKAPQKGTRQKQYNLPDDEFTAIYREAYATETKFNYIPDGGDVDQYAKMRRDRPRLTTDMFKQATANFFLSPRKRHRLKELCVDVAEFYNSAYDKYGNPTTTVGSSIQPRKPVIPG